MMSIYLIKLPALRINLKRAARQPIVQADGKPAGSFSGVQRARRLTQSLGTS